MRQVLAQSAQNLRRLCGASHPTAPSDSDRSRADLKCITSRLPVTQTVLSVSKVDFWTREVLNWRDA